MIIRRYLLREVLLTLLAVSGVLYVIYVSNRFIRLVAEVDSGILPGDVMVQIVALKSLSNLVTLLPLALFIAVLITLGRLYKDNEIVALAACGIGRDRLLRTLLWLAFGFAGVVAAVSLYGGPWAEEMSYQIQDRARAGADVRSIAAGRFRAMHDDQMVIYVEKTENDGQLLDHVFMQTSRNGVLNVISAARGRQEVDAATGDRYLILQDGYRYEGQPGDSQFKIVRFAEHGMLLEEQRITPALRNIAASSTPALFSNPGLYERAELQWRIAMPLATIMLAALAVPLSRTGPRQGRFAKLFIAVFVYMVYMNLLAISRSWMEHGVIAPLLGLWWVHGLLVFFIAVMMARQAGFRWLMLRISGRAPAT